MSISLSQRLQTAMDEAPQAPSVGEALRGLVIPLQDAPDDHPVEYHHHQVPGTVVFSLPETTELHGLLQENRVALINSLNWLLGSAWHEKQHGQAAVDLGAPDFTIEAQLLRKVMKGGDVVVVLDQLAANPYDFKTTKLGYAAMCAYPGAGGGPSWGDQLIIKALGYDNVQQLGRLIVVHNDSLSPGGRPYPVPLTYRPDS